MDKLLPCPFCGGDASLPMMAKPTFVFCLSCGGRTAKFETEAEAFAAWNRRAQPENKPLTLDELRGMDGEPVWCDWINGWAIVHIDDKIGLEFTYYDGSQNTYSEFVHLGITPLAYRYKPKEAANG